MKKLVLLSLLCLLSWTMTQAQINEDERSMSQGVKNALVLNIPNCTEKIAGKVWKKYMKDFDGKTKRNKKTDEWLSDDAEITSIGGANTVDVYASIAPSGDGVDLTAWFDLGGAFISSYDHPDKYDEAQKLMMRYAIEVAKSMTEIELKEEEKKLKKLRGNLKKLVRAKEGYERDIKNAEERIKKAEANIENNIKEQETTQSEIENQAGTVEEVKQKLSDLDN